MQFSGHHEIGNGVYLTPMKHPAHVNTTAEHDTDHNARAIQYGARVAAPAWKNGAVKIIASHSTTS